MAEKLDWNCWTNLLRKNLGKSLQNYYNSFILDVITICIDLKPSLLFDYACIDVEKVVNVLEVLHQSRAIPTPLKVLVVGEDFFIADPAKLLIALKKALKTSSFSLVDVSGTLEKPTFVDTKTENEISQHFEDLILQLEKASLKSSPRVDIEVKEGWNISTMFGFLLCYPVIYWFDDRCDYNCLSLVPLVLHKAVLNLPVHMNPNIHQPLHDLMSTAPPLLSSKVFFAFTCPGELVDSTVSSYIERWSGKLMGTSSIVCPKTGITINRASVIESQVTL